MIPSDFSAMRHCGRLRRAGFGLGRAAQAVNSVVGRSLTCAPALLLLAIQVLAVLSPIPVEAQAELARPASPLAAPELITNLHQLRQLTRDEARQNPPARLQAVVTSFD